MIVLSGKANRRPPALYSKSRRTYGVRGAIVTIGAVSDRAGRPFPEQGIKRASPRLRIACDASDEP
jgi:hypothetical protein